MSLISVRTKEGRIAYDGPRGRLIPTDRYVLVEHTNWIDRLLTVHQDIEKEPEAAKPAAAPAALATNTK